MICDLFSEKNAPALFVLVGTLLGTLISATTTWLVIGRQTRLRLKEKCLDRRFEAHEKIMQFAQLVRTMTLSSGLESNGEPARHPAFLNSKEEFENGFDSFCATMGVTCSWLRNDLTREMNLFQDYLIELCETLKGIPSNKYPEAGRIVH